MAAGPQAPAAHRGAHTAPTARPQGQGILLLLLIGRIGYSYSFISISVGQLLSGEFIRLGHLVVGINK
eukprot:6213837-Pyramimonas_sp.AAC.1